MIKVHVTPNASQVRVTKVDEDAYEVKVDERAEGGLANKRLTEILSKHFRIPKSNISIVSGTRSKHKILEIVLEN